MKPQEHFYINLYEALYTNASYEAGSEGWLGLSGIRELADHTLDVFKSKDISILDAGCATGSAMIELNASGYSMMSGIDASQTAINKCIQRGINPDKLSVGTIMNLPFPDSKFNIIFCTDVLEHLRWEDLDMALTEFNRCLLDNGLVSVRIAKLKENGEDMYFANIDKSLLDGIKNLHLSIFDTNTWIEKFDRNGFSVHKIVLDIPNWVDIIFKKSV